MSDIVLLVVYLAGAVLVAVGLWMAWPPLGVIAAGVCLAVAAERLFR